MHFFGSLNLRLLNTAQYQLCQGWTRGVHNQKILKTCLKNTTKYCKYCKLLQFTTIYCKYCKVLQNSAKYFKILQHIAKLLKKFARYYKILQDIVKYYKIGRKTAKCVINCPESTNQVIKSKKNQKKSMLSSSKVERSQKFVWKLSKFTRGFQNKDPS
jgi:hypothetical protein